MVLNFLDASDKAIKLLSCSILMKAYQNRPNELHNTSGFKFIVLPRFHAVSFVYK